MSNPFNLILSPKRWVKYTFRESHTSITTVQFSLMADRSWSDSFWAGGTAALKYAKMWDRHAQTGAVVKWLQWALYLSKNQDTLHPGLKEPTEEGAKLD